MHYLSSEEGYTQATALDVILTRHYQFETPGSMTLKDDLSSKTLILILNGDVPALPSLPCFGVVVNHDKNLNSMKISKIFITGSESNSKMGGGLFVKKKNHSEYHS